MKKAFHTIRAALLTFAAFAFFGAEPLQAHVNIITTDDTGMWLVAEAQHHTSSTTLRTWSTAPTPFGNVPLEFNSPGAPCTIVTCTRDGGSVIRLRVRWGGGSLHGEDLHGIVCDGETGGLR